MRTKDAIVHLQRLSDAERVIDECEHAMNATKGDGQLIVRCGDGEIAVRAVELRALAIDAARSIIAELDRGGFKVPEGQ